MWREIAIQFGHALDKDDFITTRQLISQDCVYTIGDTQLKGPNEISNSYEQNMIAGRKKLDDLTWGQSRVEDINDQEFYVHFTDYLTHKEQKHTHCCKQKVSVNDEGKITSIEHIYNEEEQQKLDEYYIKVGLK